MDFFDINVLELIKSDYFVAFAILLPIVIFYYWYEHKNDSYWKKKGVPYEPRASMYTIIREIGKREPHEVEVYRTQTYGKIFGFFEGSNPCISISDADIMKKILVSDFNVFNYRREFPYTEPIFCNFVTNVNGDTWKRLRAIMAPAFTSRRMRRMAPIINDCTQSLINNFLKCAKNGTPADCKKLFGAFNIDVIASSAFSTKIDANEDPDNPFVVHARNAFGRNANLKTIAFFLLPTFMIKLLRLYFLDNNSIDFYRRVALHAIEERKKSGQKGNDFLQLMMDAYKEDLESAKEVEGLKPMEIDEEEGDADTELSKQIHKSIYENKCVSQKELMSQCVMFFFVAHETLTSALSFIAYCLAYHSEVQEKVIEEIDSVLKDKELDHDSIKDMNYLDCVISETLRLYPPAVRSERTAKKDYKIEDMDITIENGMLVSYCIYAMHRDPDYYTEPEKFDPDRFLGVQVKDLPYYLPFGAGPRECLVKRFALMQMKLCIAKALRSFRFKTCPETKIPVECDRRQGFLTPKDLFLTVEERNDLPLPDTPAKEA